MGFFSWLFNEDDDNDDDDLLDSVEAVQDSENYGYGWNDGYEQGTDDCIDYYENSDNESDD